MRTNNLERAIRVAAVATLSAALLAGCAKPAPESPPPTAPISEAVDAPPTVGVVPEPNHVPTAAAQPVPEAPLPTEPSESPKSSAIVEPGIDSMRFAAPSNSKLGVAADLRYSFDSPVLPNQAVTLYLAAVPRVAGTALKVSVQQDPGLQLAAGALSVQKAGDAKIYRQQVSLTKLSATPTQVRVLVTTDMAAGSAFGFFSIPLDGGNTPQKQDSVKQR